MQCKKIIQKSQMFPTDSGYTSRLKFCHDVGLNVTECCVISHMSCNNGCYEFSLLAPSLFYLVVVVFFGDPEKLHLISICPLYFLLCMKCRSA